ncbi:UNVERIFIED_CONTAM: protein dehydration-induced [Sesamum calycinum]|uniref:Protein dehydration-induced n=1 Tax=Sesamum calycinum TaxID=2727403 RepID=A0AAW2R8Y9_9LAMI
MDSDSWARISTYSRRYQSRSGTWKLEEVLDSCFSGNSMLYLGSSCRNLVLCEKFEDVFHGEEYEGEEEQRPEFLCPFCAEDFDIVGLCCHIDEEHAIEAKNGVCPVCAKRVGADLKVVDEPSTVQPLPSNETTLMAAPSHEGLADRVFKQPPLSDEDLKEKAQRCKFVQGLVLSTFLDDGL